MRILRVDIGATFQKEFSRRDLIFPSRKVQGGFKVFVACVYVRACID